MLKSSSYKKMTALFAAFAIMIGMTGCSDADTPKAGSSTERTVTDTEATESESETNANKGEMESEANMTDYDFSQFDCVEITGVDIEELTANERSVLYTQARFCQAMTEADTDTLMELTSPDMTFTHMSGRQQTREEYFADIESGALTYYTIGIENPTFEVDSEYASVTYTSVLNANAYGARGTYRMSGTHWYHEADDGWIAVNDPEE